MKYNYEIQEYPVKLGKEEVSIIKNLYEEIECQNSTLEEAVLLGVLKQIIQNEQYNLQVLWRLKKAG